MKDCGLGAKTFTGLDTLAQCGPQGHADEQLAGLPPVELHSGQEADHKGDFPTLPRCHEREIEVLQEPRLGGFQQGACGGGWRSA